MSEHTIKKMHGRKPQPTPLDI